MRRIFSNTILATTILGMTTVPIFAAVGPTPYRIIAEGSAATFHAEVFDGAKLYLAQNVNEAVDDTSDGPTNDTAGEDDVGGEDATGEEEQPNEEGPNENNNAGDDDNSSESDQRFSAMASSGNANRIIRILEEGEEFCRLLDSANKIDCLAEVYASLARGLSSEGDAGVVKRALEVASKKLDRIVRANLDTSVNLTRPTVKTRKVNRTASRPLRAIKPSSIPKANRQAAAVVTELSTVLLRSAGNAQQKNTYYAKIAKAVDSNKVLLRS